MEFIKRRLESFIDGVVFAAIVGGGVAVWSLLSKLPPPIILVAALATFAAIIFIWNQLGVWRERTKKNISKLSDKEFRETIRLWIDKPFFKIQSNAKDEVLFSFTLENIHKRAVEIIRSKHDPSVIRLGVTLVLTNEQESKMSALSESKRADFISGLILEVARIGMTWSGLKQPLKEFTIEDVIPIDDGLTEFDLLQHIRFMDRAEVIVIEYIKMMLRR